MPDHRRPAAHPLGWLTRSYLGLLEAQAQLDPGCRRPPPDGVVRVLAEVPRFPPACTGGAELAMDLTLRHLASRGHQVRVVVRDGAVPDPEGTLEVCGPAGAGRRRDRYLWADVVITQLGSSRDALRGARRYGRPLVHMVRRERGTMRFGAPDVSVFDTCWVRDDCGADPGRSVVVAPPIPAARYATTRGEMLTLVNLSEHKGAPLFYRLAERLPEKRFLGVRGAWGEQVVPARLPDNVRIVANVTDVREIYRRTRVNLMPSLSETFGRVAVEAAVSGIPTIAHPCGGLVETLGDGATFADRDDVDAWVRAIRSLDDPSAYAVASRQARAMFDRHGRGDQLDDFAGIIEQLAGRRSRSTRTTAAAPSTAAG